MSKFSSSFVLNSCAKSLQKLNADIEDFLKIYGEQLTMHESVVLGRCRDIIIGLCKSLTLIQKKDIVLIGRNGDGKTFLLNLMFFNSCVNARMYKREDFADARQKILDSLNISEKFLGNASTHEQAQELLDLHDGPVCFIALTQKQPIDAKLIKGLEALQIASGVIGVVCAQHPPTDDSMTHKAILNRLSGFCEAQGNINTPNPLPDFILPSTDMLMSTTNFCTTAFFGHTFHMSIEFFSSSEILEQAYDWIEVVKACVDEERRLGEESKKYQGIRGRFETLFDADMVENVNKALRDAVPELGEEPQKWMAPTKADLESALKPEAKKFATHKKFIFAGEGSDIDMDRLFVLKMFEQYVGIGARDTVSRFILKKISLFIPSSILASGCRITDTPGTGDMDPLNEALINTAINEHDVVLALIPRRVQENRDTYQAIFSDRNGSDEGAGFPTELLKSGTRGGIRKDLIFLNYPERGNDPWRHKILAQNFDEIRSTIKVSVEGTEQYVRTKFEDLNSSLKPPLSAPDFSICMSKCIRVFSAFPLLYTSLTLNRSYRQRYDLGGEEFEKVLEFTNGHTFFALPERLVLSEWQEVLQESLQDFKEIIGQPEDEDVASLSAHSKREIENFFGLILKQNKVEALNLKVDNIGIRLDAIFTAMEKDFFPEVIDRYFNRFFKDLGMNTDGSFPENFDRKLTLGRVLEDYDQNIASVLKRNYVIQSEAILEIFRSGTHGVSSKIDLPDLLLRDIEKSIYKSFTVQSSGKRLFFDFNSLIKELGDHLSEKKTKDVDPILRAEIFTVVCSRMQYRLRGSGGESQRNSEEQSRDEQLLEPLYAKYLLVGQKSLDQEFSKVFAFTVENEDHSEVQSVKRKAQDHRRIFISSFLKKTIQALVNDELLDLQNKLVNEKVKAFRDQIPKILKLAFENLQQFLHEHFRKQLSNLKYNFVAGQKPYNKRALYHFFSDFIKKMQNTLNRKASKHVEDEVQTKLLHANQMLHEMCDGLPSNEDTGNHTLNNMLLMRVEDDIDTMMEKIMLQAQKAPTFKPLRLDLKNECEVVPLDKRAFPRNWNRLKTENTFDKFLETRDKANGLLRAFGLCLDNGVKPENCTIWRALASQFKNVKDASESERESAISRGEDFLRCVVARQLMSFVATSQRDTIKEAFGFSPETVAEKVIIDKGYWPGEPLLFFFLNAFTHPFSLALNIWVADCVKGPTLQYNSVNSTAWSVDAVNVMLVAMQSSSGTNEVRHGFAGVIKVHHSSVQNAVASSVDPVIGASRKRESDSGQNVTPSKAQRLDAHSTCTGGPAPAYDIDMSWIDICVSLGSGASGPHSSPIFSVYIFDFTSLSKIYTTSRTLLFRGDGTRYFPNLTHVLSSLQKQSPSDVKIVPVLPCVVYSELKELAYPQILLNSQRTNHVMAKGILTQIANLDPSTSPLFSQQSVIHHKQVTRGIAKTSDSFISFAILECALQIKTFYKEAVEVTVIADDEAMKSQYSQTKYRPAVKPHFSFKTVGDIKQIWLSE